MRGRSSREPSGMTCTVGLSSTLATAGAAAVAAEAGAAGAARSPEHPVSPPPVASPPIATEAHTNTNRTRRLRPHRFIKKVLFYARSALGAGAQPHRTEG